MEKWRAQSDCITIEALTARVFVLLLALSFVLLYVPTVFTQPFFLGSDAGVFYTVFHQLSLGKSLYVNVFDHKDPLFHYAYGTMYYLFGTVGPMLWETIITVAIIVVLLSVLIHLRFGVVEQVLLMTIFLFMYFSPRIYYPVHTYHQSILLWLVALRLSFAQRRGLAGGVASLMILSKMPMAVMAPSVIWVAAAPMASGDISLADAVRRVTRATLGLLAGTMAVAIFLAIRGELPAYVEVIQLNFHYSGALAQVVGWPNLWDRFNQVFGRGIVFAWLAIALFDLALVTLGVYSAKLVPLKANADQHSRRSTLIETGVLALFATGGMITILAVGSFFNHYFQMAGPVFVLDLIPVLLSVQRYWYSGVHSIAVPILGSVLAVLAVSGFVGPFYPRGLVWPNTSPVSELLDANTLKCLIPQQYVERHVSYATVEQNNPGILAGVMPSEMRFRCRLSYQFPWFGSKMLSQFAECIDSGKVDVVYRRPYMVHMPGLEAAIAKSLDSHFHEVRQCGDVEIWARIPG